MLLKFSLLTNELSFMFFLLWFCFLISMAIILYRLIFSVRNFLSFPALHSSQNDANPGKVSIIIPVRNEEREISNLIDSLKQIQFENFEVLIGNDSSEDKTFELATKLIQNDDRFKIFNTPSLPSDWMGKPYTCNFLAEHAEGDYLLFIDADVRLSPKGINQAVCELKHQNADLLTLFPVQTMKTPGEWATVPIVNFLLLSFVYLPAVSDPKSDSGVAIGQFMLFDARSYHREKWHQKVRHNITEDVAIMRKLKQSGGRGVALLATDQVYCRMYHNFGEAFRGMSKNIVDLFDSSIMKVLLYMTFTVLLWPAYLAFLPLQVSLAAVGLILINKIFTSRLSSQSFVKNLLYHPFQAISISLISIYSIYLHLTGGINWKGRKLQ